MPKVVLVSCVSKKSPYQDQARYIYLGAWFTKARYYAEREGQSWYILSALHGLLAPATLIKPYNATLNTMSRQTRFEWATKVAMQIKNCISPINTIVVLAGKYYRKPLLSLLPEYTFEIPLLGLGIGQQLAWLNQYHKESI